MESFPWLCGRKADLALRVNGQELRVLNAKIATQSGVATQIA